MALLAALEAAAEQYREWWIDLVRGRLEAPGVPGAAVDLLVTCPVRRHVPERTVDTATIPSEEPSPRLLAFRGPGYRRETMDDHEEYLTMIDRHTSTRST